MGKSEILLTIVAFIFGISMFVLVSGVISGSNNVITTNRVFNDIKNIKDIVDLEKTMDLNGSGIGIIANNLQNYILNNKNYLKVFEITSSNSSFKIKSKNSGIRYDTIYSPSGDKFDILILIGNAGTDSALKKDDDVSGVLSSESLKKICPLGLTKVDDTKIKCGIE